MNETTTARIKLLDPDIASQIAAGEVIERPASVLKELLENSIDAGATQITIHIQRGGMQLIQVRDNGGGIVKDDLQLALQQHATSKIRSAHELSTITSLGFRGEALASINAVAKLTVTSKANNADSAWCIHDMIIEPAAHPPGTTITMRDLFYNLPARRKFLRSERTEYLHLEEVFRRIALSNFAVGFNFNNQDKLVKNLLPCNDLAACTRRLTSLCGQQVIQHALQIDIEQNGLRLWGWLGLPHAARSQEAHQYFFINKRVIRDRLINHAIREVYTPLCQPGKMPFYCLYLELDPVALDVNVHPTKHEVRFRDARIIHEFLVQALRTSLHADFSDTVAHTDAVHSNNQITKSSMLMLPNQNSKNDIQLLASFAPELLLARCSQGLLLIDLKAAQLHMPSLISCSFAEIVASVPLLPEGRVWRQLTVAELLELTHAHTAQYQTMET